MSICEPGMVSGVGLNSDPYGVKVQFFSPLLVLQARTQTTIFIHKTALQCAKTMNLASPGTSLMLILHLVVLCLQATLLGRKRSSNGQISYQINEFRRKH